MEQFEGDGRAMVAAGSQASVADYRQQLSDFLYAEFDKRIGREERELRQALGVA